MLMINRFHTRCMYKKEMFLPMFDKCTEVDYFGRYIKHFGRRHRYNILEDKKLDERRDLYDVT